VENRNQENRFLQPIQDNDPQGQGNPRVFLKAKMSQAVSLQPTKSWQSWNFYFPRKPSPNLNFGPANFTEKFELGAQGTSTPLT